MSKKLADIPVEILKKCAEAATRKAKRENKKLGMSEVTVIDNHVVRIEPNGDITILETLHVMPVKVTNRKMKLGTKKNS